MGQPFLAYVIPVSGGQPDQGLPGQPPGIWPSPGYPSHPIAPGGPPPGIWPGQPGHRPDQGLPGQPGVWPPGSGGGNRPDQGLPGQPPGIWPGPGGGYPDQGLPPGGVGIWPGPGGGYPDQGLPGGGSGAQPKPAAANVPPKPSSPPSGGEGTYVLVMVAPGVARWAWVTGGSVDNTLPRPPGSPDQGLPPGQPGAPDQGLPPESTTKPNPVPTPQRR